MNILQNPGIRTAGIAFLRNNVACAVYFQLIWTKKLITDDILLLSLLHMKCVTLIFNRTLCVYAGFEMNDLLLHHCHV